MSFSLDDLKKRNSKGIIESSNKSGLASLTKKNNMQLESRINTLAKKNIKSAAIEIKKNAAEVIFIIDKSGSCRGLEHSTITGINDIVKKERRNCYPTKMTLILFDEEDSVIYDRQDIKTIYEFSYNAGGGTALYDAICKNLYNIKNKQLSNSDVDPNKTIVAIMTDGEDNESKYSLSDARKCILDCKNIGWKFIFLGALKNAKDIARELGIDSDMAEVYQNNNNGILANFESINRALFDVKSTGHVSKNWSDKIKNNNLESINKNKLESGHQKILRLGGK